MTELEEILRSLKIIKAESNNVKKIDSLIDELVLKNKRTHLYRKIRDLSISLVEKGLKEAHLNFVTDRHILVVSMYMILPGKTMRRGHFPTVMNDTIVVQAIENGGEEALKWGDSQERRLLYLTEFEYRTKVLLEAILDGKLDDKWSQPPNEIIHKILGQHGELLPRLGINPREGTTYKKFKRLIQENTQKKQDSNVNHVKKF